MRVTLPALAGSYGLEWVVRAGARVEQGQVLAWLAVADHCALLPLNAPASGVLTARWSELISSGRAGTVVAAIDGDDVPCLAAQRRALEQERLVVIERLETIDAKAKHPTAFALLEPERHRLSLWLAECDQILTTEAGS